MSGYRGDLEALSKEINDVIDEIRILLLKQRRDRAKYEATEALLREMKAIKAECADVLQAMDKKSVLDYAMALKQMRAAVGAVVRKLRADGSSN